MLFLQPPAESGVALGGFVIFDGDANGLVA
jgi:hypothetical protein